MGEARTSGRPLHDHEVLARVQRADQLDPLATGADIGARVRSGTWTGTIDALIALGDPPPTAVAREGHAVTMLAAICQLGTSAAFSARGSRPNPRVGSAMPGEGGVTKTRRFTSGYESHARRSRLTASRGSRPMMHFCVAAPRPCARESAAAVGLCAEQGRADQDRRRVLGKQVLGLGVLTRGG